MLVHLCLPFFMIIILKYLRIYVFYLEDNV